MYTGVTNDLERRLFEHKTDSENDKNTFVGKYNCIYLLYYEHHTVIDHAIEREKQIKGKTRLKKNKIITDFNPEWRFLNDEILDL